MSKENEGDETGGIANLRKEFEERGKQLEAALARLSEFETKERTDTLNTLLKAKGLEGRAKFYTADDISEDAVNKWADENAALFGVKSTPSAPPSTPAGPTPVSRINDAMHDQQENLPGPSTDTIVYGDPEQIQHALDTLSYEELVKLGYMPAETGVYGVRPGQGR